MHHHASFTTLESIYLYIIFLGNPSKANMESSRSRKSKGFVGLTCIFGGRQHWEVLSYRQCHLAASLPQSRWRSHQGFADASGFHWNHWWPALNVGYIRLCYIRTKGHLDFEYPRAAMKTVLQAYGWKGQAASHPRCSQIAHPPSPDPGHSMGSGKRCSATAASESSEARLLQGHNWSGQAGHYWGAPSPQGHHRDGEMPCVEATVLQLDAQTSASAALSVRMMRTLGLICCWTVAVMMMNESIRWSGPLPLKCNDKQFWLFKHWYTIWYTNYSLWRPSQYDRILKMLEVKSLAQSFRSCTTEYTDNWLMLLC